MLLGQVRRGRILYGRRAGAIHGDAEPEGRRSSQLLRRLQEGGLRLEQSRRSPPPLLRRERQRRNSRKWEEFDSRLKALGKSVEMRVYPDTGHAFFNDTRPQAYNKTAAEDSW